eukprot:824072-Amphidinium_carterae.3
MGDCPDSCATVDLCYRTRESRIPATMPFVMHVPSRLTACNDVAVMNMDSVIYVTNWERVERRD